MRVASTFVVLAFWIGTAQSQDLPKVVESYCSGCHNGTMRSPSNVLLEQFDAMKIADNPEPWARVYRQLQAGTMPPVGASRPDRATYDASLTAIEQAWRANTPRAAEATNPEIATRLAALLWNSAPDAALLRERLTDTAILEQQIKRMLADDRAEAFVSRFFLPWLELDKLSKIEPAVSLRESFEKETSLFLLSQLREDRDPLELWSANYTFLNEQLAKHYDIPNVTGTQFRRVTLTTPERFGLLGQGSILTAATRHDADMPYTTPATRAKWVRQHFLGVAPPNPFPGAQPVKPDLPITPQTRTLPVTPCITCHQNFFPLGYALENFDPLGRWRTNEKIGDQIGPVDASGKFVDGTPTNGVVEMRNVLLRRPDAFRTTLTEKLLGYTANGSITRQSPETLARAREILSRMPNARWSALIAEIVK